MMPFDIIILIDDSASVNFYNQAFLRKMHFKGNIYSFLNTKEAYEKLQKLNPSQKILVIVDLNLTFENGLDFLRKIDHSLPELNLSYLLSTSAHVNPTEINFKNSFKVVQKPLEVIDF